MSVRDRKIETGKLLTTSSCPKANGRNAKLIWVRKYEAYWSADLGEERAIAG